MMIPFPVRTFWKWANGQERPTNGSLVELVTADFKTQLIKAE